MLKRSWLCLGLCVAVSSSACGQAARTPEGSHLDHLRRHAESDTSSRTSANWLLAELLEPEGDPEKAKRARQRLDRSKEHGLYQDLARGLDDSLHGRLRTAPGHFLKSAEAAQRSNDPAAPLLAWFAVEQAAALSRHADGLWERWRPWVEGSIREPRRLGWRARDVLVNWWGREAWVAADQNVEERLAQVSGCVSDLRLAGPFGTGEVAETVRSHPAEDPLPWPVAWQTDPLFGHTPRVLKTEQKGCWVRVDEALEDGVVYVEARFELAAATEVISSVENALAVWVDGELVLERDLREWGSWARAGAGLALEPGPHRLVARLNNPSTRVRLLRRDGSPIAVRPLSHDPPAGALPPRVSFEANELRRFVHASGVHPVPSSTLRYVAAHLASLDGEAEAATLLLEPLVATPEVATGAALAKAAELVEHDPIYEASQTQDLARELHARALKRDPDLWESELQRVAQLARSRGVVDAVRELDALAHRYPEVPGLLAALASVYGELGWMPEYRAVTRRRAEKFPTDADSLYATAQILEEEGEHARAEALYQRIRELDPDTEVLVGRAIERRDYPTAIAELQRLHQRRPERKDLKQRLTELDVQAGRHVDRLESLRESIERDPKDGRVRLQLADALYSRGDAEALSNALVSAIEAGASTEPIKAALDLVQGVTELEPYRLDGRQVIAEYEASGKQLQGTAARVLDYMAVWVRNDGSSRYLEHEIVRIQSDEGINRFAEQDVRGDQVLRMRVLKRDGRILEPELVAGKPTVTFPHLEIGDYIETEVLFGGKGSPHGVAFDGPRWFFREHGVAYARSEFVLISPASRPMVVETVGDIPTPQLSSSGGLTVRRWRVDDSPAAVEEPLSVPPIEYLPNLHVSWGLGMPRHLALLARRGQETVPVDPRIVRVANAIVKGIPADAELERARLLYRWVLDNVQKGEEIDGRRAVIGKRGNQWRAFTTLCRSVGIPVVWALAKNRLAPPPKGPASEAAQYAATLLRVGSREHAWVSLGDKYAPFGYVPVEIRGVSGFLLDIDDMQPVTIPSGGERDRLEFDLRATLEPNGHAELEVSQIFAGRLGSAVRQALSELGERQVKDAIESNILGNNLRGARLLGHEFTDLDQLDRPLRLQLSARMANFALPRGKSLRFSPPYAPNLSQLATLPARQTPLLITNERNWRVRIEMALPPGAEARVPPARVFELGEHKVAVSDRIEGRTLILERQIEIATGRITPAEYPAFVKFVREADAAITAEIPIQLP